MRAEPAPSRLPAVVVVGRPNVGKSSLVNRILGRREAIVEERPGVTRDRRSFVAQWAGRSFEIVDTGGLERGAQGLEARVVEQAHLAMEAADVILFVVDAATGATEDDLAVADLLRRSGKPVLLAANKVDDAGLEAEATALYRLGLGDPVPVSALHGRGSGDLLSALVDLLPEGEGRERGEWASAAIVGRPNVGKSSLLNVLLDQTRALVDDAPGTTRDPVDSFLEIDEGRVLRVVDTAGMRREVQIKDPLEYFGFLRSRNVLGRADVAVLVIDVSAGVTSHDQRLAQEVVDVGRACVVALNKWDLVEGADEERARLERTMGQRLRFLQWAPRVRTSALTGRGARRLLAGIQTAVESHRRRLPTNLINRVVSQAQHRRPHPRTAGRQVRVLYAAQVAVSPPTVALFSTAQLEPTYLRYLEKEIRREEPFAGAPLCLRVRVRSRPQREE